MCSDLYPWASWRTRPSSPQTLYYIVNHPYISGAVTSDYWMADLMKLTCSWRGHKGHLSKLLSATEEILDSLSSAKEQDPAANLTSSDAILLAENLKQLHLKANVFKEIDDQIIDNTDDDKKLEAAVFKVANLQVTLLEKMALVSYALKKNLDLIQ